MSKGESIISISNLSKVYYSYDSGLARLYDYSKQIFGNNDNRTAKNRKEHWALKDVNIEIKKGESLGIIGRNGAGKSTLLQIIAGTLAPTHGNVNVRGRVNALLELGSGFNPEFSGRENVFLNGSILGFSYSEIEAKFHEILEFSEIGSYIDQPVKTYSSGMFVKLAFSVQALLRPEVLIVDEALSVGDVFFQNKCINFMQTLMEKDEVTFIFVSHSMNQIQQYCKNTVLLIDGEVGYYGDSTNAVSAYFLSENADKEKLKKIIAGFDSASKSNEPFEDDDIRNHYKTLYDDGSSATINKVSFSDSAGLNKLHFDVGELLSLKIGLASESMPGRKYFFSISFKTVDNIVPYGRYSYNFKEPVQNAFFDKLDCLLEIKIKLDLRPDNYLINLAVYSLPEEYAGRFETLTEFEYTNSVEHHKTFNLGSVEIIHDRNKFYSPFAGLSDLESSFQVI
ncbi:polysaccharide ABC transporter ATP-binding protein [Leptospira sp. 'Mane']|uniref:ABC transporter ATP-binding protein n=1 Tax=Leptospira sp. 'Mane' TaxID=3387407 RepID=UPI00398B1521